MGSEHRNGDDELAAMSSIRDALMPLDEDARARVIRWVTEKFRVSPTSSRPNQSSTMESEGNRTPSDLASLFHAVDPKTDAEKVLAVAYFLQQSGGQDIESFRVNSELKQLGFGVGNVTRAFDKLMDAKPAFVMQTRKSGTSQQARKKFRVTDHGVRTIERMLQGQASEIESGD